MFAPGVWLGLAPWACLGVAPERFLVETKLSQYLVVERWSNFASAMDGIGYGAAVGMKPALVAA